MNPEDINRVVEQTAIVLDVLEQSQPIEMELSGGMAYLLLCQLQIAFESPVNQNFGVPSNLWDFYQDLAGKIVKRCPQVIQFLPEYDLQNSEEN